MFLGPNMLLLRKIHGKTLEEVAERLGVDKSTVQRSERGGKVSEGYLTGFCSLFFVDPAALQAGPLAVPVQIVDQVVQDA